MRVTVLTARQCTVLRALERGDSMKVIAHELGVSVNSVGTTAKRAYRKLGVASKKDAIRRHKRLEGHVCELETTSGEDVT